MVRTILMDGDSSELEKLFTRTRVARGNISGYESCSHRTDRGDQGLRYPKPRRVDFSTPVRARSRSEDGWAGELSDRCRLAVDESLSSSLGTDGEDIAATAAARIYSKPGTKYFIEGDSRRKRPFRSQQPSVCTPSTRREHIV